MNELAAEFQDVLRLYGKLADSLTSIMNGDEAKDSRSLVQSILENQDGLMEIQNMNARVLRIFGIWESSQANLDPVAREEIRTYADAARAQALRLQEICSLQEERVQSWRNHLAKQMQELGDGARYLKMLKPVQGNYPKFIDSAC